MVPGVRLGLNENYCFFGVSGAMPEGSNKIVLGDVFMYNFYTVFDSDNKQIGLTKSVNGYGQILDSMTVADWAIPFIIIGVVLVLVVTALFVICRTKSKFKREKAAEYYE